MSDQPAHTDTPVQNIPIPPSPMIAVSKSSNEILSELFGAFNATPPSDDPKSEVGLTLSTSISKDKSHKKRKKGSKEKSKKHKKEKKKKRTSSSDSTSSKESRKKSRKKTKKDKSKHVTESSESSDLKRKKKRKLGKFSASDSDSEEEKEFIKKKRASTEKLCKKNGQNLKEIKIKHEKEETSKCASVISTVPGFIQESVLKSAVSKIVDKVIGSTHLTTTLGSISKDKANCSNSDYPGVELSDDLPIKIKQEPQTKIDAVNEPSVSGNDSDSSKNSCTNALISKPSLPVADVFAEDLIDSGIKEDELKGSQEKTKLVSGKIKIQNLKFSQVYEATVKEIEEKAKEKAEKYEEGELTDSSSERHSPTPSLSSSSGSVVEIEKEKHPVKKKHRHHHRKHRHHESGRDRRRSPSKDKPKTHSNRERSLSRHRDKHNRDERRRKSREEARSKERSGHSRSRSPYRSGDMTKERKRSKERGKSRDKSKDRIKERKQSRERSRSRDKSKDRKERKRSKDRSRSRERSKDRRERRRSKDRSRSRERSKDRLKEKKGSKEQKNRVHSKEGGKRNDDRIDKKKLLEIARKNALNMMKTSTLVEPNRIVSITAGGKTVNELTNFCKMLSQKDAEGHESISSDTSLSGSESESEKPFHHPFQIKERTSGIVLNIRNSVALPVKSHQEKTAEQAKQLRLQFPVSSGSHHRKTESEWRPVSPKKIEAPPPTTHTQLSIIPSKPRPKRTFTDTPVVDPPAVDLETMVSQRLTAFRINSEAQKQLYQTKHNMLTWRDTQIDDLTGQFTGSTGVRVLSQAELASGQQAWARKDQLQVAAPVSGGMGMTLLQKMGWRPGEGLGKNKEGALQPLLLEVKTDKKGLVAQEELPVRQPHQTLRNTSHTRSLDGKHPVSLLSEYCSRRKFGAPHFDLVDEAGPDHKKNFLFRVRVNGVEYKPAVGSPTKKQARAEAAEVCLRALGILTSEPKPTVCKGSPLRKKTPPTQRTGRF